jgi:two-component system nitrogen regulation response regulator GlnG/two-component system response regulator HydG
MSETRAVRRLAAMSSSNEQPMDDATVPGAGWTAPRATSSDRDPDPALVIAWSRSQPGRVGEVAFLGGPDATHGLLLGRGEPRDDDGLPRLAFHRHRPAETRPTEALAGPGLSRRQLLFRLDQGVLAVENVGKCPLRINGVDLSFGALRPGDTLLLEGELLLLTIARARAFPRPRDAGALPSFPFGEQDPHGIVGESPAAWALREQIAFAARADVHVLLLGPSGSGKELCAQAIHRLSARGARPLVSRSAATLPPGLIDAELFGNVKHYPQAGMPERPGLIGEADGSTLFLDEIGELSPEMQAHLLRVLDAGGEYQRLGEAQPRRSDLRLLAATNRREVDLKHDFAARFQLRVALPGLDERRDDIPLLARWLLRDMAARDPALGAQLFDGWDGSTGEPRIAPELVDHLLRRSYTHHVRELSSLLWSAVAASFDHVVALPERLHIARPASSQPPRAGAAATPSVEDIQAALDRHDGNVSRAWRDLGLSSRDALNRLLRKHGIGPRRPREG